RMAELQAQVRYVEQVATPQGAARSAAGRELNALKEQLAAKRKEMLPEAAAELRAKARLEAEAKRRHLTARLEVRKKQERTWTDEANRLITEDARLARGAPDLEKLNDDIIGLEAATRTAREQLETAKMEALAPSRVTLLEKPVILPKDTAK